MPSSMSECALGGTHSSFFRYNFGIYPFDVQFSILFNFLMKHFVLTSLSNLLMAGRNLFLLCFVCFMQNFSPKPNRQPVANVILCLADLPPLRDRGIRWNFLFIHQWSAYRGYFMLLAHNIDCISTPPPRYHYDTPRKNWEIPGAWRQNPQTTSHSASYDGCWLRHHTIIRRRQHFINIDGLEWYRRLVMGHIFHYKRWQNNMAVRERLEINKKSRSKASWSFSVWSVEERGKVMAVLSSLDGGR